MIPVVIGITFLVFMIMQLAPGDPVQMILGDNASPEAVEAMRDEMGLNDNVLIQYGRYLVNLAQGDMGTSYVNKRPVADEVFSRVPATFKLAAVAAVVSIVIAIPLGILAAIKQNTLFDHSSMVVSLIGISMPAFWLALLLLMVFSVWLGWFPIGLSVPIGAAADSVTVLERLHHAVLPALTLSITGVSSIALHTREKMVDVLESDYVLFARARGERLHAIVLRHGLRNVALPAITLQFASVSEIIGGSVLVEQVFSYPGLGQAAVNAGLGSDLPLLLGITVITAAIVFAGNLAADLLYGVVDPKIRRGAARR